MQYRQVFLASLPLASASLLRRADENYAQAVTVVATQTVQAPEVVVTITQGAPAAPPSNNVQAQDVSSAAPVQYSQVASHASHNHAQFHSSAAAAQPTTMVAQPSSEKPPASYAPAPAPQSSAPASSAAAAPSSAPASGSSGSGGCPADTSGQHMSPGCDGKPSKSMIDSINYLRRLYNPEANCLSWSDSLASHSQTCASEQSESSLRVNSAIVSAPGYGVPMDSLTTYSSDLAHSDFERSMLWMLCQSPSDPALKGTCHGVTADAGCTYDSQGNQSPPGQDCTGHADIIKDAKNTDKYMGCGVGDKYISCSFSGTQDA